jgi:hypothetical protein
MVSLLVLGVSQNALKLAKNALHFVYLVVRYWGGQKVGIHLGDGG